MILVSKEIQDERLATCKVCPLVIVQDKKFARDTIFQRLIAAVTDLGELQCSVCGCPAKLRAKQSVVGCPKGKWKR